MITPKSTFALLLLSVFATASSLAQRQIILDTNEDDWAFMQTLDEDGLEPSPADLDENFFQTWNDQSFGNYFSPRTYDGPAFQTGLTSPFYVGEISGISTGTSLGEPENTDWQYGYFLKVVDGGEFGFQNLAVELVAKDGAIGLVNGTPIFATTNISPTTDARPFITGPGDGSNLIDTSFLPTRWKALRPGANLLAVIVGRAPGQNDGFGFQIKITGTPGIPPITRVTQDLVGDQLHLRFATSEAQKTTVRLRNNNTQTTKILKGDVNRRNHHFSATLAAGNSYTFEILDSKGEPWEPEGQQSQDTSGSVTAPFASLIEENSDGWYYLQARDGNGNDIDPSLADPDFYETWFKHIPGGDLPSAFKAANYDGPSFQPTSLPIHYGAEDLFPNAATVLTPPSGGDGHTLWLLKTIDVDGPGFSSTAFRNLIRDGSVVYLNGKRVDTSYIPSSSPDRWDTHAEENGGGFDAPNLDGYLFPGKNLLAISVHSKASNNTSLGISATLEASVVNPPEILDIEQNLEGDTFTLKYLTGTPQPTVVNFGINRLTPTTIEIPEASIFHEVEIPNLQPNQTYFFEILRGDGSSFFPKDPTGGPFQSPLIPNVSGMISLNSVEPILEYSSSGWLMLHSLDENGLGINPALSDPDFATTWMTFGIPGNTYDGPTFTPDNNLPIVSELEQTGPSQTVISDPGDNRNGALYLIRELEGPATGATELDFEIDALRRYRIFLNGALVRDTTGLPLGASDWDHYWESSEPQTIERPALLHPGSNILAISLHPLDAQWTATRFNLRLSGRESVSNLTILGEPTFREDQATINWFTPTPSPTRLRFGPSLDQLDQLVEFAPTTFTHSVSLPLPSPFEELFYEILQPDGSPYHPPALGSFTPPAKTIIPFKSEWTLLDSRDPDNGTPLDPALTDPDFNQTWTGQSFNGFAGDQLYDGPAFSSQISTPFPTGSPPRRPRWLLKVIDGGSTGLHNLTLDHEGENGITVFLNGHQILQDNLPEATRPIWSQERPLTSSRPLTPLPKNLILQPGPNLIAVLIHTIPLGNSATFDLSLSGYPIKETTRPFPNHITSSSIELTWATRDSQFTTLRWGTSFSNLESFSTTELPGTFHRITLDDLKPATTYLFEVLKEDENPFDPPIFQEVTTRDVKLLSRESQDWAVLQHIEENAFTDPVLIDNDFYSTWFDQSIGAYQGGAGYNGPAFLEGQTSPFVSDGLFRRPLQSVFPTINDQLRPVWLLKEIDGGEDGYHSLVLEGIVTGGMTAFLNGEPLLTRALPEGDAGQWSQEAFQNWSEIQSTGGIFSQALAEDVTLNPGPNLLAIALHPYSFSDQRYSNIVAEFELRGRPAGLTATSPVFNTAATETYTLSWTTSEDTKTQINYGIDPSNLEFSFTDDVLETDHQQLITAPPYGGTFTFEILSTNSNGETVTTLGTFEFFDLITRQPYLQKATPDSITIRWRTRMPDETSIRYGTDPNNLDQLIQGSSVLANLSDSIIGASNESLTDHTIELADLQPATRYYYQISSSDSPIPASDPDQYFQTPPLTGTPAPTRIWVTGNTDITTPEKQKVKEAFLNFTGDTPTDVWLGLGDQGSTDFHYRDALFNSFPEVLKNTPFWPTLGNRDAMGFAYKLVFDLPTHGEAGGYPSGNESYYSFDHGNIHFICLNSNQNPESMADWIKEDLRSTRADWIIAYFHHAPYTLGNHNSDFEELPRRARDELVPILEKYGIDLILSGESDNYERSHLFNGLHGFRSQSTDYDLEEHSIDLGAGSPLGFTDPLTGIFRHSNQHSAYQKPLGRAEAGTVAVTLGTTSIVGRWWSRKERITNPEPHPVHASTLRVHGSMVIDVDDKTLTASFLDLNGQIRDHFQIKKVPDESPAIVWWRANFGDQSYPVLGDWFANPDSDSFNNLAEFVHGFDPNSPEQEFRIGTFTDQLYLANGQPTEWFTIRYPVRAGSLSLVEYSQNMSYFDSIYTNTSSSIARAIQVIPPDENGVAIWESRVRRNNQDRIFFRIRTNR